MPVSYEAPVAELSFLLNHVTGLSRLKDLPEFSECTPDLSAAILDEAAKFARDVIRPLNQNSESQPPKVQDGVVTSSPGYRDAYQQFIAAGWNGLASPIEHGGQGLCEALSTAVSEMWQSASMSFALCPMLTAGAIHAIEHHANPTLRAVYLEKLVSGQWTGTMNLTEPLAGSDLAAIATKATPQGDHYLIRGSKIFITYGEHDFTENIIHLVLARLPDAPSGVKGISLFIVPKYLVQKDGQIGARNDLVCTALEHKIGIHGSPTAVMQYGETSGAIGYLVGEPHQGLAYMFTMMNHARLQVGLQGVAVSQSSLQQAQHFAHERIQGRTLMNQQMSEPQPIAYHPDVARMLLTMQAKTQAMRALTLEAATELDLCTQADAQAAAKAQTRVDLLIPIVKGWCTEQAVDITSMGIQVHGGMGYIEETGIGQFWRDARITPIYEGTTAIQANDFISRKLLRDEGQSIGELFHEIQATADALQASEDADLIKFGEQLEQGLKVVEVCAEWCLTNTDNLPMVYFASVPFLMLSGFIAGGWMMGRCALASLDPNNAIEPTLRSQQRRLAIAYGGLVLMPAIGLVHVIGHAEVLTKTA